MQVTRAKLLCCYVIRW